MQGDDEHHDHQRRFASSSSTTEPGSYVLIQRDGGHQWALTAAHCVSNDLVAPDPVAVPAGKITLRIGSNSLTTGGLVATGAQVYLHPDWMWGANDGPVSDLALVRLTHPIGLPTMHIGGSAGDTGAVRLIGWGLTTYPPTATPTLPDMLQQIDTTRLPATACADGFIGTGEICTGNGACFGDSGGPALQLTGFLARNPVWSSVGIASRETNEDTPCGAPSVYTDVTYYLPWISTTMFTQQIRPCICPPSPTMRTTRGERMKKLLHPNIVR